MNSPKNSGAFTSAMEKMFSNNQSMFKQGQGQLQSKVAVKNLSGKQKEIAFAVTILLVELSSSDQNFDLTEYNVISNGLRRLFGASKEDVTSLVNQATVILQNLRGTSQFSGFLKDNLGLDERKLVLELIDELINADGKVDDYEIFLRHKYIRTLGLEDEPST